MELFKLENLFKAYLSCRQNKRRTYHAQKFEENFEKNLLKLSKELQTRKYTCGKSICFVVEYPKLREVFASEFRDRVVHHLLVNKLETRLEQTLSHSSFACRKDKGTLRASQYLKSMMLKISKNAKKDAYYGQFDIKSFFMSIDKEILFNILSEKISKRFQETSVDDLLWLCEKVIFHDPTQNYFLKSSASLHAQIPKEKSLFGVEKGKGLPIGNLTSQFFANVYLNELDQYIKRVLKVKYYVRYVDDIVLLSESQEEIYGWREAISSFLSEKLALQLQASKDKYGSIYSGIDFVGYVVKPKYVLTRKRIVKNLKNKLFLFNQGYLLNLDNSKQEVLPLHEPYSEESLSKILATINSYYGHLRHSSSYRLRKKLFETNFGTLQTYLKPDEHYYAFNLLEK